MKKILITLIVLSIVSCLKEETPVDYAIFSGKIENLNGPTLSVRNSKKVVKDIVVKEDGTFMDTIQNVENGYFTFRYNNETSSFYLKAGDNLILSLDTKEFDESIKYSGAGSNENNYLAQKFLKNEGLGELSSFAYLGKLSENDYLSLADSTRMLASTFLNEQKEINDEFKTLEEASIKFNWINKLARYEMLRQFFMKDKEFKVSENYPDYTKGLNFNDESLLSVNDYNSFLNDYYRKKSHEKATTDSLDLDITFLNVVSKEVSSEIIKQRLLFGAAKFGITNTKDLQEYYDVFMANSNNDDHKNEITEKYKKLIRLVKGQPSPKFVNYENYKGGTTSLDDLIGKYVYIDVWATWCGPCKREIPFLKEIEVKYHGKNIAFVSLSVDVKKDHEKWLKMIAEKELGGIQLFADNDWKSQFVSDYGIQGIPRFILIDPNGNIVDSNAPRPSDSKLVELFDELSI